MNNNRSMLTAFTCGNIYSQIIFPQHLGTRGRIIINCCGKKGVTEESKMKILPSNPSSTPPLGESQCTWV